jgi:protein tyrosine/serine phosphatase
MKNLLFISLFFISTLAHAADPVGNFFKVNNSIYRGARPTSKNALVSLARDYGVKSIINLQGGDWTSKYYKIIPWLEPGEDPVVIENEGNVTTQLGMNYLHSALNSLEPVTPNENFVIDQTLKFMHDPRNQPVFIHCEHGKDRTGLLVALYKVKYEHANVEAARKEWIAKGHSRFSQIFTGNLDDYYYEKVKEFSLNN